MKGITINLPDDLRAQLKERARKNKRSLGAEIRFLSELALASLLEAEMKGAHI